MGLKMIGIGQNEIHKKVKKEILATAWSICKTHYKKVIGGKTDKELVEWANARVGDAAPHITKLDDKTNLGSGVFWIKLIATIEARGIDEELVTAGETEEDAKMNAKYAISLARSIGAVVFMVWEDMVAANSKQCLIFASTLYDLSLTYGANKDE
jgi:plastin-1